MLIECKIRRDGGSIIDLFDKSYHFQPVASGEHVCDVAEDAAVDRFLEIPEGYCLFRGKAKFQAAPAQAEAGGIPANVDEMTRDQMLAYAEQIGMRKPHPAIGDEKLRANIAAFLELRASGGDEPEPDDEQSTETQE